MSEEKLWTIVISAETDLLVDAFDQSDPVCGGGPDLCGGCRDCIIMQCEDGPWVIEYDVTTSKLTEMGRVEQRQQS
jgi:hypothetical protein